MKKTLAIILAMIVCLGLASCGKNDSGDNKTTAVSEEQEASSMDASTESVLRINKKVESAVKLPHSAQDYEFSLDQGIDQSNGQPRGYYYTTFTFGGSDNFNGWYVYYFVTEGKDVDTSFGLSSKLCTKQFERDGVTYGHVEEYYQYAELDYWQARWEEDGVYHMLMNSGDELTESEFRDLLKDFFAEIDE